MALLGEGRLRFAEDCTFGWRQLDGGTLVLTAVDGLERGLTVVLLRGGTVDLSFVGLPIDLRFASGRPWVQPRPGVVARFGADPWSEVAVQLVRGDQVLLDDHAVEVG